MQRRFPESLTRHSYWLAVLIPLLLPLGWSMRGLPGFGWLFAWVPLLVLYVLLTGVTWLPVIKLPIFFLVLFLLFRPQVADHFR